MAVVLVTGGSSGIGLATVQRLAAAGDRVFAASRNPSRGPVPDGVTPIAVDFFGPLRLARAAVPIMREQGSGRIVNVTSMNGVLPAPFGGYYSASKAALASASLVLDAEVHGFGIRVTVVAPGLFKTEMADSRGSYRVADGSPYRAAFQGMTAHVEAERATADPDEVAVAVEKILRADDPPAQVVVGSDAVEMAKMVHDASPDDLGALLRDFVSELAGPVRRDQG